MNTALIITVTLLVIISALMLLLIPPLIPVPDPYSAYNIYWDGYSKAVSICNASISYYGINNATAIILIPMIKPPKSLVEELMNFTVSGGTLIIISNGGYYGNYILKYMGLNAAFANTTVVDPIMNFVNEHLPVATVSTNYQEVIGAQYVILDNTTYIEVPNEGNYEVMVWTSPFSTSGITKGPFPIVVLTHYGRGIIVLISDPAIFMNSLINHYGNAQLLRWLCSGKRVVYMEGFIERISPLSILRIYGHYAYKYLRSGSIRYLLVVLPMVPLMVLVIVRETRGGIRG
jgi:hypothetical protein